MGNFFEQTVEKSPPVLVKVLVVGVHRIKTMDLVFDDGTGDKDFRSQYLNHHIRVDIDDHGRPALRYPQQKLRCWRDEGYDAQHAVHIKAPFGCTLAEDIDERYEYSLM